MIYELKIVQKDFKSFELHAEEKELTALLDAIKEDNPYFAENGKGIYIPHMSVRYILINKRIDECQQKNQSLEAENDSPLSKEN